MAPSTGGAGEADGAGVAPGGAGVPVAVAVGEGDGVGEAAPPVWTSTVPVMPTPAWTSHR